MNQRGTLIVLLRALQGATLASVSAKVDAAASTSSSIGPSQAHVDGYALACPTFTLAAFEGSLSIDAVRRAASSAGYYNPVDAAGNTTKEPGILGSGSFGTVMIGTLYGGTVPVAVKVRYVYIILDEE